MGAARRASRIYLNVWPVVSKSGRARPCSVGVYAHGKSRSLVRQVLDRFDSLMATGKSRHAAKLAMRAAGERAWSVSDGHIHAFRTRKVYQAIVLRLVNW